MNLYPFPNALLFFCFIIRLRVNVSNPTHFTGDVSINCGATGTSAARNGREWIGDVQPKSPSLLPIKGSSTISTHKLTSSAADPIPHKTARISQSQFSYAFQVSPGQKILRLHFNPSSSYKGFKGLEDLFTVEAGPFTLLSYFSASLTAAALGVHSFTKEFCLNIQENQQYEIIFSPESSRSLGTYAFINGIEIVSVPAVVSYFQGGDTGFQLLGEKSRVHFDHNTALEISHRLEIKQTSVPSTGDSDDIFPKWTTGNAKKRKNNTWKMRVDVGFMYLIRVHFSELGHKIADIGDGIFEVLINEKIALTNVDLVKERDENNITWYRDYMVRVRGNKKEGKLDLLISLQLYNDLIDGHALLSGFEILKLSNSDNSLASPNPLPLVPDSPSHTIQTSSSVLFRRSAISFSAITIISLANIIVYKLRKTWEADSIAEEENKPQPSARAERLCRRFSLAEIQLATNNFRDGLVIGRGGFGKVYKGHIDHEKKAVAIKRLKSNSKQGAREFLTEIETLSELRHVNLVSLIGYCNEHREMILVYEYMPCGTLADHLYKLARESESSSCLTWKQRLDICIGAGRGLDYLHTGHGVIHRDVKASNILLDENFIAKVSDFGLAKLGYQSKLRSHVSTNVKGTYGYLDPNYLHTRQLTSKSDTYAFGVVLLEVLCGRPAEDLMLAEDERVLPRWAQNKIDEGEVDQIVAASMREEILPNSLKTFVGVAKRCLRYEPKKRPTMSQVVLELELAVEQQERKQPLEIASASDDNHHTNDKVELSVTTGQPTMSSTVMQDLTPSTLKEQRNNNVVIAQLPYAKKHGITAARRNPSPLWSWDKFWNRAKPFKGNELLLSEIREGNIKLAEFDSETIAAATDQFSFSNVIAYDTFGRTYKAVLPTGQVVAIKCLSPNSRQGNREFFNEIKSLSNLQHRNVIKLLGYCVHRDEKSVVYEFTGNTCLRDNLVRGHLHLQWQERFKIVMGIARGLIYLHRELGVTVIHRDLNTGNILLDNEMNPKISNFAFARTLVDHQSESETNIIAGTSMLMPPEYAMEGKYSTKSDVYSFGIIILEMAIGTRTVYRHVSGVMSVVGYAWKLWNEDRPLDVVDKSLGGTFLADEVLRCIQVGLLCTEEQPHLRPEMLSVVKMLEGDELIVKPLKPWIIGPIGYSACSSVDADDGLDSNATMEFDDTLER